MELFMTAQQVSENYNIPLATVYNRVKRKEYRTTGTGFIYVLDVENYVRNGYIYLIKMDKYYKIGKTSNPSKRFGAFSSLPYKVEPIITTYVKDNTQIEKDLHEEYKDYRVRGEWFELNDKQVEKIIDYLKDITIPCT